MDPEINLFKKHGKEFGGPMKVAEHGNDDLKRAFESMGVPLQIRTLVSKLHHRPLERDSPF